MKVLDIKTHEVLDVSNEYGARLIGQGRAVLAPTETEKPVKKAEPVEAEAEEGGSAEGDKSKGEEGVMLYVFS